MFFLASHGYRVIADDRRGYGRSSQPWQGNDMDHYADDLAELVEHLELKDAVHIGHSTRRRRGRALYRPTRYDARGQGGDDRRSAAVDAQNRDQS